MDLAEQDLVENSKLAGLIQELDNIDGNYVNRVSDEIYHKQPFFLTVLLGYRLDVSIVELEEIMKVYFLVWSYFRPNKNVQTKKVSKSMFEKIQQRNAQMFKYADGEHFQFEKKYIFSSDLVQLQSKALLTAVLYRFNQRPILQKMEPEKKGIILIGIKSFIQCFETL